MTDRRAAIEAEIKAVEALLNGVNDDARIEQLSLRGRLEALRAELAREPALPRPRGARLVFDGRPVIGTRGVYADFAADSIRSFTEALTCIAASVEGGPLAPMGPIPNRESHRVIISGTARGSFGFHLEPEVPSGQQQLDELPIVKAMDAALEFLESTSESDEKLSDALERMDDRALNHMRTFLGNLSDHEALCGLSIGNRGFRFPDVAAVRRTVSRIGGDNIEENEIEREIKVQGVLPFHRRMEFSWAGEGEVLYARISAEIPNPNVLNERLGETMPARLKERRVGNASPRYTLLAIT